MPKPILDQEQYQQINDKASASSEILEHERFAFLKDFLYGQKAYYEQTILNNTLREYQDVTPFENFTRIFKTPKKLQLDELRGRYKMVCETINLLESAVEIQKQTEDAIANELVIFDNPHDRTD